MYHRKLALQEREEINNSAMFQKRVWEELLVLWSKLILLSSTRDMENPLNIPFQCLVCCCRDCVLDVSLEQKKPGWREEEKDSGCSSVTLTHEALISREEVEQKGLQNLVP